MPTVMRWRWDGTRKRRVALAGVAIFVVLLITGSPVLVSARNTLQNLWGTSWSLKPRENHQQREEILKVLGKSAVQRENAMEIARTVVEESRKSDIPISLFMAIMKKESNFDVEARSRINAMGVMQIHPLTWDAYMKKMNLDASRKQAFDPGLNIRVSAALLRDLRDQYAKKGYQDRLLWDYVLSAYYAGAESLKGGMKKNHRNYVKKVREYADEWSRPI